jgi:hypothetical protein
MDGPLFGRRAAPPPGFGAEVLGHQVGILARRQLDPLDLYPMDSRDDPLRRRTASLNPIHLTAASHAVKTPRLARRRPSRDYRAPPSHIISEHRATSYRIAPATSPESAASPNRWYRLTQRCAVRSVIPVSAATRARAHPVRDGDGACGTDPRRAAGAPGSGLDAARGLWNWTAPLVPAWKPCAVSVPASGASGSTINGACAFAGNCLRPVTS